MAVERLSPGIRPEPARSGRTVKMANKFKYISLVALTIVALLGSDLSAAWAADDFATIVQNLGAKS